MNKNINGSDWQIVLIGDPTTGLPTASGGIQSALLTDGGGAAQRVKVDLAQTSFFQGLMYRYFRRLNIAVGASVVIKITAGKNFVLYQNSANIKAGDLDVSIRVGCTELTAFTTPITIRPVNGMTNAPVTASALTIMTGGSVDINTGTEINTYGTSSANGIGANAASTGGSASDEIGVANGSVSYLIFTAGSGVGAVPVIGTHYFRWEER